MRKLDYNLWIENALNHFDNPSTITQIADYINAHAGCDFIQRQDIYHWLTMRQGDKPRFAVHSVTDRIGQRGGGSHLWWWASKIANPIPLRQSRQVPKDDQGLDLVPSAVIKLLATRKGLSDEELGKITRILLSEG